MSFNKCSHIGDKGVERLMGALTDCSIVVPVGSETETSLRIQKAHGDLLIQQPGLLLGLEVKVEEKNKYNNFFIEIWSSSKTNNPGWAVTLGCDILAYSFLDTNTVYFIQMKELRRWGMLEGNFTRFPLKSQWKYNQMNLTLGRPIPIPVIKEELQYVEECSLSEKIDLKKICSRLELIPEV